MNEDPRGRRRNGLRLFSNRVTPVVAVMVFLWLILSLLVLVSANDLLATVPLAAYLLLVLVTWAVVAGIRREPGSWLGRRAVRRALVVAIAADCVGLIAS